MPAETDRHALAERFWSKVAKSEAGCWEWQAGKNPAGYGLFRVSTGKRTTAHRMAWWLTTGRWPAEIYVCHRCDNPGRVRPDHLFLGTNSDNIKDCLRKGRHSSQRHPEIYATAIVKAYTIWRSKTHCKHGHEYTFDNTTIRPSDGARVCLICARRNDRAHDARERAAAGLPPPGPTNRDKTHCKHGHEFTPQNTRIKLRSDGSPIRVCRTCTRRDVRERRALKKRTAA